MSLIINSSISTLPRYQAMTQKKVIGFSSDNSPVSVAEQSDSFQKIGDDCLNFISKLEIKSSTKNSNPADWNTNAFSCIPLQEKISEMKRSIAKIFTKTDKKLSEYINAVSEESVKNKIGNCTEQAILAARYIKQKYPAINVNLVNYMGYLQGCDNSMALNRDHCFVVLGLPKGFDISKLGDKESANSLKNVSLIDAWAGFQAPLQEGLEKIKNMLGLRKYDTSEYSSFADKACAVYKLTKDIDL
jgi:hypothetical protein